MVKEYLGRSAIYLKTLLKRMPRICNAIIRTFSGFITKTQYDAVV